MVNERIIRKVYEEGLSKSTIETFKALNRGCLVSADDLFRALDEDDTAVHMREMSYGVMIKNPLAGIEDIADSEDELKKAYEVRLADSGFVVRSSPLNLTVRHYSKLTEREHEALDALNQFSLEQPLPAYEWADIVGVPMPKFRYILNSLRSKVVNTDAGLAICSVRLEYDSYGIKGYFLNSKE